MEIRIPLNEGPLSTDISRNDVVHLNWVGEAMKNRNFDIQIPGWKFDGVIESWTLDHDLEKNITELVIKVQL